MSKARRSTIKPKFLKEAQWTAFRAAWGTKEQIAISKQNSSNRCRDKEGPCTHTGGSKSHLQHAIDLKNNHPDKKDPSHCELFVHTHKKDDGSFVDQKSSSVNVSISFFSLCILRMLLQWLDMDFYKLVGNCISNMCFRLSTLS